MKMREKMAQARPELIQMVSDGYLETAYCMLEEAIGSPDQRGWGWSIEPTVDLMQRIIALCPGEKGIGLAVDALCGLPTYGEDGKYWKQARFDQDVESARCSSFVVGLRIDCPEHGCATGRKIAGSYRLDDLPAFPPAGCSSECGCICHWESIFDDDPAPSVWRKKGST